MTVPRRADDPDQWSAPSFYEPGQLVSPPAPGAEELWGVVTYVGRPKPGPERTGRPPAQRDDGGGSADRHSGGSADRHSGGSQDRHSGGSSLLASSRVMAIGSLASRVTGFLRSVALVAALGAGLVGDAYNGANSFPNMVYELLLGGVLSSVLIPLLVHAQEHDRDRGEAYTARLLSVATAALAVATVLAVFAAPLIAQFFVPIASERSLTTVWARLLLPEIFFYGVGAMFMAVLNTRGVYGPGAWAPVLNNLITIITVAIFLTLPGPKTLNPATITTAQVYVMGIGTTLGIVAQAVVLWPFLRRVGFRWRWRLRGGTEDAGRMAEVGSLTGWVLGYVVASQIGVSVITKVAFSHEGVTKFANADLLFQVPYGILGVSLLTALMPRLARSAARGDQAGVVDDFGLGARLSGIALLPVTFGLFALAPSLGVVLFAHGRTSLSDARLIGDALALSAFGLLPFALVMLQLRVFYAMKDARTPTLINVGMVGTKVVLVLLADSVLHGHAVVIALNVSTSLSYVAGAALGQVLLARRFKRLGFAAVRASVLRMAAVSAAGAVVAYLVVLGCRAVLGAGRAGALAGLVAGSAAGLVVLALAMVALRVPELTEVRTAAQR